MEIIANVKLVIPAHQVTEKVKKAQLIVDYTENPSYNQVISFEAINDKCALLDDLSAGDEVTVHFNLNGREWTKDGKTSYFNSLQLWRIEKTELPF